MKTEIRHNIIEIRLKHEDQKKVQSSLFASTLQSQMHIMNEAISQLTAFQSRLSTTHINANSKRYQIQNKA